MAATNSFLKNEPPILGQLLTLAFGFLGAMAARWAELPGAALSGSMMAVALLSVPGKATSIGTPIRLLAMALSGTSIGSAVTPETLRGAATYPLSIFLMAVSSFAVTGTSAFMLMKVKGWNRATAFLASTPGALSSALIIAAQTDADVPRIVVVQMFRVFFLMALLPMLIAGSGVDDSLLILGIMIIPGVALGWFMDRRKIAGGMFLGIMAVSAIFHGTSVAPGRPPDWFMIASQVLIGSWIGSRFVGFNWRSLGSMFGAAVGSMLCTLTVSALFAALTSWLLGFPFGLTMLAFAPGAFEAMTMLAFALGLDPLYAVAHHLARLLVMTFSLPIIMRLWLKDSMVRAKTRAFR